MQNLLADLCVESEASTLMAMKMSELYNTYNFHSNNISGDKKIGKDAGDLFRICVAVSKYYITKRLPNFVYECMEVLYFTVCESENELVLIMLYSYISLSI